MELHDRLTVLYHEKRHYLILVALVLALMFVAFVNRPRKIVEPPRPLAMPKQTKTDFPKPLPGKGEIELWGMDEYVVEAVIMGRERYRFGTEAKISPVDFVLAWGPAATEPSAPKELSWQGHANVPAFGT